MKIEDIKAKFEEELSKRGMCLVWSPEKYERPGLLIVFGAEQAPNEDNQLIAGCGPFGGFNEDSGNSPISLIQEYHDRFLSALETVGIPRSSLQSTYPKVGRGKIWPIFVARLTQETFQSL